MFPWLFVLAQIVRASEPVANGLVGQFRRQTELYPAIHAACHGVDVLQADFAQK